MRLVFAIVQGLYFLSLGTWFGATVLMGAAAGTTFAIARRLQPRFDSGPTATLPDLQPYSAEFFAGDVVNRVFGIHTTVLVACAVIALLALALQHTLWRDRLSNGGRTLVNLLRVALVLLAAGVFAGDLLLTRGPMSDLRGVMYDERASVAQRAEARAAFAQLHGWSSKAMGATAVLAAIAAVVSPLAFMSGPSAPRES